MHPAKVTQDKFPSASPNGGQTEDTEKDGTLWSDLVLQRRKDIEMEIRRHNTGAAFLLPRFFC